MASILTPAGLTSLGVNTVTSAAGTALALATGTTGTAISIASATNLLTLAAYTTAGLLTNNGSGAVASLSNAGAASATLLGILGSGSASSTTYLRGDGSWATAVSSVTFTGDGTVLSSTPSSAITTSGTVAAALANAAANTVLANNTGSPAAPTYTTLSSIFAAPPAIGGTTAAAGTFTSLALANGGVLEGDTTAAHTWGMSFRYTGAGPAYEQFFTATNSATAPTAVFANTTHGSVTWNGSVIGPAYGGLGVANNAANTVTFSGNYGLTLTLTNTTGVTLPTSGTLVNSTVTTLSSLVSVGTLTTGALGTGFTAVGITQGGTGQTSANAALNALLPSQGSVTSGWVLSTNGTNTAWSAPGGGGGSSANPSATIGLSAVNGSATTFMTSDSAPALSQAIAPTWTGVHNFSPAARTSSSWPAYLGITTPADTGLTASTEFQGVTLTAATRTWANTASNTVTLQREVMLNGQTYQGFSAGNPLTITDAATLCITPPAAGSHATFTRGHTLLVYGTANSATSAITGELVVGTGTAATSVGIGAGNIYAGGNASVGGTLAVTGKTSLTATGTLAGLNIGSYAGDPSSLSNGDVWYNSSSGLLKAYINGAVACTSLGGMSFTVSGNGSTVVTGQSANVKALQAGMLVGWTMVANQAVGAGGNAKIEVDVFAAASGSLPTASILGGATKPAIANGSVDNSSSTLTSWTTAFAAGTNFAINVTGVDAAVTSFTFTLFYQ